MKRNLLVVAAMVAAFNLNAQEAVVGGNMEDSTKWTVTQLVAEADKEATAVFNYTENIPVGGAGGAMHVTATNFVGGSGNNAMIWQKVNLKAGHRYVLNAAFLAVGGLPVDAF